MLFSALLLASGTAFAADALVELERALAAHVASRTGVAIEDIEVQHLGVATLPECAEQADFVLESAPGERFVGAAEVDVVVLGPDAPCTHLRIRPRIQVWREVPVAVTQVEPGQRVEWSMARVPHRRVVGALLTPARLEAGTWLARTTVAAGEPLTELVNRPEPDALGGQDVVLVAGAGGLLVMAPGRLVADAFLGDSVSIANLASQAVVVGTLLTPGCAAAGPVTPYIEEACGHAQLP